MKTHSDYSFYKEDEVVVEFYRFLFGNGFEYELGPGDFVNNTINYLPTSSYYQLEDYKTGEVIYPLGEYTKISCDSTSNYFNISLFWNDPNDYAWSIFTWKRCCSRQHTD
mgnify:CR=1 FL=1